MTLYTPLPFISLVVIILEMQFSHMEERISLKMMSITDHSNFIERLLLTLQNTLPTMCGMPLPYLLVPHGFYSKRA
uniref:Secreted protein n=1 Tax=Steinernema glaseri TaxID=37863 RepID=A0A1I7ZBS8_9BILA